MGTQTPLKDQKLAYSSSVFWNSVCQTCYVAICRVELHPKKFYAKMRDAKEPRNSKLFRVLIKHLDKDMRIR